MDCAYSILSGLIGILTSFDDLKCSMTTALHKRYWQLLCTMNVLLGILFSFFSSIFTKNLRLQRD